MDEDELAWLLKNNKSVDGSPAYLTIIDGRYCWTTDESKAIQFARKEDVEMASTMIDNGLHKIEGLMT